MTTITITLEDRLEKWLNEVSAASGQSPEEIIKDTLRRRENLQTFKDLQQRLSPYAERAGITSEEEIFDVVSEERRRRGKSARDGDIASQSA